MKLVSVIVLCSILIPFSASSIENANTINNAILQTTHETIESNLDANSVTNVVRISEFDRFGALINALISGYIYHKITTPQQNANGAILMDDTKKILTIIITISMALNLPVMCYDEIDADLFHLIKLCKGAIEYAWTGCCIQNHTEYIHIVCAILCAYTGTMHISDAIKYFTNTRASRSS